MTKQAKQKSFKNRKQIHKYIYIYIYIQQQRHKINKTKQTQHQTYEKQTTNYIKSIQIKA